MKRIAMLLLALVALPVWAQTLTCHAGAIVTLTCAGPIAPTPTPIPTPAPVPPPPAPAPPSGWSVVVAPASMAGVPLTVGTGITFRFSAPANVIHAHRILYTGVAPYAGISMNQLTNNTNPRDAWISTVPGALEVSSPYCRKMRNGLGASFDLSFVNSGPGYCNLQKGTTYYLNVKASDPNTPIDYLVSL
ncbi:MAG: hypothetical protein U1A72_04000 [Sulfuritalea sp.]|nr:hypothetical protein [Sulfuritalea sp.]